MGRSQGKTSKHPYLSSKRINKRRLGIRIRLKYSTEKMKEEKLVPVLSLYQEREDADIEIPKTISDNAFNNEDSMNAELSTRENHPGHQSNLHGPGSSSLVECNVDPKLVLDVEFVDIQVKSESFHNFDNGCFESINIECTSEQSSKNVDTGNDNIDIKDEQDIEIGEIIVKSEFSDSTYDEKCSIYNPIDSSTSKIKIEEEDSAIQNVTAKSIQKRYICTMCEYSSAKPYYLKRHMRTHTGEKPFTCTICDYATTSSSHLTMHVRSHTGEKPYQCTMCQFASAASAGLKSHMRLHTGEKPYKCGVCEYASVTSRQLKLHMHKHTGVKPYKCNLCDYACAASSNLKSHMTRHAGEKRYTCPICDYASARARDLKLHMHIHTEVKPYNCSMCEYAAATPSRLKVHMRIHIEKKTNKAVNI